MATKRIVKFILRMIVAAAVVVGGYFLIKHLTSKSSSAIDIINASNDQEVVLNYQNSYDGLLQTSENGTALRTRILTANGINEFLIEYYNHYLTLTVFQWKDSDAAKNSILKKIDELSNEISETKKHLNELKNISTSIPNYNDEKQLRLEKVTNDYFNQTKTLFELNELLKNYAIQTNYGSTDVFSVYEIQLEVVKDYAKYVFDNEIFGKLNEPTNGTIIVSDNQLGFNSVLAKFNNRQTLNKNSREEVRLFLRYLSIEKPTLNEYFSHVKYNDTQEYINSIENLTTKLSLTFLNDYLMQTSF